MSQRGNYFVPSGCLLSRFWYRNKPLKTQQMVYFRLETVEQATYDYIEQQSVFYSSSVWR
ncbi:CLUMA_CG015998, isoform A [Clunio marinus]|uniref:CLUMA_CG015998, isoform A n=1 Tax=Clunio marinus TaxID=568069 RepID=A0A1J1IUT4_9DIPT|nr:CLUMA_CG015998, isoform A [Clunio marinus]